MTTRRRPSLTRRACLIAALGSTTGTTWAQPASWAVAPLPAPEPLIRLRAAERAGWVATGEGGGLWWLRASMPAQRLAAGIDPLGPLDADHGRVVARRADGRLWVGEGGREASSAVAVARDAGLVTLPLGIIAVRGEGVNARLVRLEPDARGSWQVTATSREAVLPDARPVQVDLDGGGAHIAVLAGPDSTRYKHAVLGDAIEATRVLLLERHDLMPLRELTLAAPHVFEDNHLRVWREGQALSLVAVRSGPNGGQLALIEADRSQRGALRVAALGEPIGTVHRWLAPSSDGERLVAVHTPHLSGALHSIERSGERLLATPIAQGLSNHTIGAHDLDVAAWLGARYVLADLSSPRTLRTVDVAARRELLPLALPVALRSISADAERRALACVLADGSARVLTAAT
jgi:hypothetical protein